MGAKLAFFQPLHRPTFLPACLAATHQQEELSQTSGSTCVLVGYHCSSFSGLAMDLKISDKAFQLAKEWVKSMSGGENLDSEDTDAAELKTDGRPARLGLGAEYVPHSQLTTILNPLEKKLKAKLDVSKGAARSQETKHSKTQMITDKSNLGKRLNEDMDGDDDEAGRASQFNRKQRSATLNAHLLEPSKVKKKRKNFG